MPAYVLIRETKKEGRAPLRVCIAAVAGLGLASALLSGTAYGQALAAGLLRFLPFSIPASTARAPENSDHVIRIKEDSNGQYYVKGSADGVPLEFMIDSGASYIVLPKEAAGRMNVGALRFDVTTTTANGRIQNAQITIHELNIGPYTATDIPAVVNGGELEQPLLGMSWLRLFKSIEIQNGVMTLRY